MTTENLNLIICEIIIPQKKPRSSQNSNRRKQWENRRNWRLCTVSLTCKLGNLKDYEKLYKFYNGFNHWIDFIMYCRSAGRLAHIFYDTDKHYFKLCSYHRKYHRQMAAQTVRRYKGEISNGGMYRKIYDYYQCCI